MKNLDELYRYALTFHGRPYVWGGEGPVAYDCSGLVQAILRAGKVDPPGDQTADLLYRHFLKEGKKCAPQLGALAFFGTAERVVHIGWCVDQYLVLNAAGGSSHVNTIAMAEKINASVKVEPLSKRGNLVAIIMPRYQFDSAQ